MSHFSPSRLSLTFAFSTAMLAPVAHAQTNAQTQTSVRAQTQARKSAAASFRGLGMLGSNTSLTQIRTRAPRAGQTVQSRVAAGSQNLTGPIKFNFVGFSSAQSNVLQKFVRDNYGRMVTVFGAPAPEQAGKTVTVRLEAGSADYEPPLPGGAEGGTIYLDYVGEPNSSSGDLNQANSYNFTRLALQAFQGPRVPAYDFRNGLYVEPWLFGMTDAAALQIAFLAQGSPANFNPASLSNYALNLYDYLNRPELGNAFVVSRDRNKELAISFFRAAMAQAAFLKIGIENPQFFAQFNAKLYARGAAGASISPDDLKGLAASVTPTVEGRSFGDWVRAQYVLDATVTTGQKLYLIAYPITTGSSVSGVPVTVPTASVFAQAFTTNADGSETAAQGYGSLRAFDQSGRDISDSSGSLRANNVLSFNDSTRPGEASAAIGFNSFNESNRMLVTLKANYNGAEATNYVPYGAAGTASSASSFFGGTLGGQNGTLQLSGSAAQNVSVTNGTWAASAPYPSGPRVQTQFSFGGATLRRNTAWLVSAIGSQQRSVAFLLQVPSSQQTLNFVAPAGQSQIRMVSLPGIPLQSDEAAALNLAPSALKLARYRPNLSPASVNAQGALVFGIGGSNYEIYPNISGPLTPGRGYWLGVNQSGYSTQVQASPPPADKAYQVPLRGGWNQIGVPFNRTFAASAIRVSNGGFAPVSLAVAQARGWVAPGIWRWRPEGGYVRADTDASGNASGDLAPFEGYFIFAGPQNGVSLIFDPTSSASSANASLARSNPGGWSLSLHAKGEQTEDIAGRFGVSSAPNIAKPPVAAQVVSLRFEGADENGASAAGSGLAESYVGAPNETGTKTGAETGAANWTAVIDGAQPGERVTVKWGKFESAMQGLALSLTDGATGAVTPMKSGGQYQFTATETPRRLTIALGAFVGQVAPTIAPNSALTADVLTATPNASGFAANAKLVYSYVWRNGDRALDETGATLDLAGKNNGDRGDTVSVEVTARDEAGNAASGTTSVVVGNSDPLLSDGTLRVQSGKIGSVELFASDADGDELRLSRSNAPKLGVADVRKEGGVWKLFYAPYRGASGADEVKIVAFDGFGGRSREAIIKVSVSPDAPANKAPVAYDGSIDSAAFASETALLLASDADGDALSFKMVGGTQFGSSEIFLDAADGKWKLRTTNLRHAPDGVDSARFVAVDAMGRTSNVATISIRFHNRPPVANDASASALSGQEIAVAIAGSDADGDALTYKRVGGPRNGTGELRRDSDGLWKLFYRSRAGWTGVETVRYVAVDESGRSSAPATVSIDVTPGAQTEGDASAGRS